MKETLSYVGTVHHLVVAIENDRAAYDSCVSAAKGIAATDPAWLPQYFAERFKIFDTLHGDRVQLCFPWLISTKAQLASAWGQVIHDLLTEQ